METTAAKRAPRPGDRATHVLNRSLDARDVVEVSEDGSQIRLRMISGPSDWLPASNYTYQDVGGTSSPAQVLRARIHDVMRRIHTASSPEELQAAIAAKTELMDELRSSRAGDSICRWDEVVGVEDGATVREPCQEPAAVTVTTIRDYGPGSLVPPRTRRRALCAEHADFYVLVLRATTHTLAEDLAGSTLDIAIDAVTGP